MGVCSRTSSQEKSGSSTASAKVACFATSPPEPGAISTSSIDWKPTMEPVPYWISNLVPSSVHVLDKSLSYLLWFKQAKPVPMWGSHLLEGTHKLEEPVSKMTVKFWGGVPMVRGPKY